MKTTTFSLIAVLGAALFATALGSRYPCEAAYKRCGFRFEGKYSVPTFDISGPNNVAFTPRIVTRKGGQILGVVNMNTITPEFISRTPPVPITWVGRPRFTSTAFKPFSIPRTPWSGIGHQNFHGNQLKVASRKCIRVFFSSYQLLSRKPGGGLVVVENKNNVPRRARKCVVFRTRS